MFLQARNSSPSHVVQYVMKTFPPASSHFPSRRAARLGGAPFKSCPGLSKLSQPIRSPSVPVREAVFLLFNVGIPPTLPVILVREAASKTFK